MSMCKRCKCCETEWMECWACGGEGVDGHDRGEDTCCCLDPEDNVICNICEGDGGWKACVGGCNETGVHEKAQEPEACAEMLDFRSAGFIDCDRRGAK